MQLSWKASPLLVLGLSLLCPRAYSATAKTENTAPPSVTSEEAKAPEGAPTLKGNGTRVILEQLEASVNSGLILSSDVKKFRTEIKLRSQLDPLFAGTPLASHGSQASHSEIVDFLIDEKLITQLYPKTDAEVEQEINTIQTTNRFDRATLKEALSKEGFKFNDYFEMVRTSGSKRELIERDIRPKVTIAEDDIRNYYYNHYSRSSAAPQAYQLKIISISEDSFKGGNKTTLASKAANQALKDIQAGEKFEEVAKRVSEDSSASTGGELGTLTEDQMAPAIRQQAKKLTPGQVSEVFSPVKGRYLILKLVDVRSSDYDRLDKMKEEIRGKLAASEYQHQVGLWLERRRQTAFIHRAGEPSIKAIPIAK